MLFWIVVILSILLLINLMISKGDWLSPGVIFQLTFLASALSCVIFQDMYALEFHIQTVMVVFLGGVTFTVVNAVVSYVNVGKEKNKEYETEIERKETIYINKFYTYIMLLCLIIFTYQMITYIQQVASRFGGGGDLATSIGIYNYYSKFTEEISAVNVRKGFFVRNMGVPCTCYGYMLLYVAIYNWVVAKKWDFFQLVYLIIYFFGLFITGTRGGGLRMLTAALILYVFFTNKRQRRKRLRSGQMIKVTLIIISIAIGFFGMRSLIGRSTTKALVYTIFPYLGGPLANLDYYLQGTINTSKIWGEQTFAMIINNMGGIFNRSDWRYMLDLPFMKMNGLNSGNVYTLYYMFIHDFGYEGIVPLTSIIAIYSCYTYNKILRTNNKFVEFDIRTIIYAYLFNDIIMLMFSNRFYENAFRIVFIKYCIGFFIIKYIIRRSRRRRERFRDLDVDSYEDE